MISIKHWLSDQIKLNSSDPSELRYLIIHLLDKNTAWLYANEHFLLNQQQVNQLDGWCGELKQGKPLAYITGEKAFWTLNLKVNEHTLIPRPETEILIEIIDQLGLEPQKILDLGTGSGAIALSLATLFPAAQIVACDVSKEALSVAQENAELNQLNQVKFIHSNWFDNIADSGFDLIVSNPPYIDVNDEHLSALTYEPITALVADEGGLAAYKDISENAKYHLSNQGILMFEHGWQQHQSVAAIMKNAGFVDIRHQTDLLGHQRVTWGIVKT